VRLRLAGALRMFGADLATLVDRAVAAVDVLPTALRPLCSGGEHVASERLIDEVVACVRRDAGGERTSQAIERIQRCNGRVEIAEVARGAGVSTRQLDRDFERFVGISPKLVARIARFRRVFERSHSARRGDWTLLADAAGYADQAHMTREFREFAGMAPDAWRRQLAAADV
jgi:AraC-like DNA-binding protein